MFESKAGAHPSEAFFGTPLTNSRLGEKLARDKHSSLHALSDSDKEKSDTNWD